MSHDPRHIAEGLDAIHEAMIATICCTGGLPSTAEEIPAAISFRLGRRLRRIDAKYARLTAPQGSANKETGK